MHGFLTVTCLLHEVKLAGSWQFNTKKLKFEDENKNISYNKSKALFYLFIQKGPWTCL